MIMGTQRHKRREEAVKRHRGTAVDSKKKPAFPTGQSPRVGRAAAHKELADDMVHVFVDDQNLFWGIVNDLAGRSYRIDFGELLTEVSKDSKGKLRAVKSAYIAGVIPDDDSFWQIAANQGFTVKRGYLGMGNRSKQDDAYLITEIVSTLYERDGPSTIVLVAGDADYVPPLIKSLDKGWRNEVAFINRGASASLEPVVHEFRLISPYVIEHLKAGGYKGDPRKTEIRE
jgi:uncharacterized LabA/DUF88 family protein